ncbi:hypothetical protein SNOG_04826 [Parastagonospora nodorum SN15]|uniref:Uncharacterized protein n=1 Tax=Phaeosphaeria nodorum (strain SN15 / ATCC MYA-4574 / FGSC 10173) TaxID=321614 RepID=Q0UTT8_PHANO|nr:hypothetical protein SNOG_04826 [Parastagonospora nodorum SN15]EAT87217.1 hypothetical protein SNOG_04826 [Parastagonospora nodorum SN15]
MGGVTEYPFMSPKTLKEESTNALLRFWKNGLQKFGQS